MKQLAFIGYGKVGRCLSHHLARQSNIDRIQVYLRDLGKYRALIEASPSSKIVFTNHLSDALAGSDWVVSAVWPGAAAEVAEMAVACMAEEQIFLDLNTISAAHTEKVASLCQQKNVSFVKGAIMGGTEIYGASVPILLGGPMNERLARELSGFGLHVQGIGEDPQKPAMIKVIRSVLLKGITALLHEAGAAGEQVGMRDLIIESAVEAMTYREVGEILKLWLQDIRDQPERRIQEMDECKELLEQIGVEPIMTLASRRVFERMRDEKVSANQ